MTFPATEHKANTVTDNYISIEHEYFSTQPTETGQRVRMKDTWYAVSPQPPQFEIVNPDDTIDEDVIIETSVPWTLHHSGNPHLEIADADDIAGLRKLLDAIEAKMHDQEMTALYKHLEELDKDEKGE